MHRACDLDAAHRSIAARRAAAPGTLPYDGEGDGVVSAAAAAAPQSAAPSVHARERRRATAPLMPPPLAGVPLAIGAPTLAF